jgi:hypothetical protein
MVAGGGSVKFDFDVFGVGWVMIAAIAGARLGVKCDFQDGIVGIVGVAMMSGVHAGQGA